MKRFAALSLVALMLTACSEETAKSIIGLLEAILSGSQTTVTTPEQPDGVDGIPATEQSLLELPADVRGSVTVSYSGYTSSYNQKTLIPDWVAYELTSDETYGDEERGDRMFSMDKRVKGPQAMREDYSDSGWTKGHMAPASDFRWSADAMDDTFHFTNVCPQNEYLNGNDWEYLERQVRSWAKQFGKVWVTTGPVIGTNKYGCIGERDVVVPDAFFKAVLAFKNGKYKAIAFVMGNDEQRYWLQDCAVSVDDVEKLTGLDLYPALDDAIEESVESQISLSFWGI